MTQHLDLDALQAAAEAATPGPWYHVQPFMTVKMTRTIHGPVPAQRVDFVSTDQKPIHRKVIAAMEGRESAMRSEDMAFIAAFNPQTCRALIDRLRKAEAAREGWKMVPRIPTADMVNVFMRHMMNAPAGDGIEQVVEGLALMIDAAPDSTPTDSADSEGAKG